MKRMIIEVKRRLYVNKRTLRRVENYLKKCKSEYGASALEVAEALKISPITARKYLDILVAMNKANKRFIGSSIFYSIKK